MTCDEARLALEAEPGSTAPALAAHVQACPECSAHRTELLELDQRLRAALQVPVPQTALQPRAPVALEVRRPQSTARFALAASLGTVAVLVGLLWGGFPRRTLAADVVAHMAHEPAAWSTTAPLPVGTVSKTLDRHGLALRSGSVDVTYAATCWFRNRFVPHLVVATAGGPVTVMVLPHERLTTRSEFDEQGYHGVLVPTDRGVLAVLARTDDEVDVDAAAARALGALQH
ncbi:MAG TPA: DUF3379 family protein [Steroidobacteraceae bacterium]